MAQRETIKTLQTLVDHLNIIVSGNPKAYTKDKDGYYHCVAGAYVLDAANGGYRLNQIVEKGSGEREITGRDTAGATARAIRAYMSGFNAGERSMYRAQNTPQGQPV